MAQISPDCIFLICVICEIGGSMLCGLHRRIGYRQNGGLGIESVFHFRVFLSATVFGTSLTSDRSLVTAAVP